MFPGILDGFVEFLFAFDWLHCFQVRCIPDVMTDKEGKEVTIADPISNLLSHDQKAHYAMLGPSIKHNLTILSELKVRS